MFKKISQPIFFVVAASVAAVWQWSFIHALPSFASQFNLVLIVAVFTLFFFGFESAAVFSVVSGFWLDLIGFNFFGLYLFSLLATIILIDWLLSNWLTNRSLYSFSFLIFIASAVYSFMLGAAFYFSTSYFGVFFLFRSSFWSGLAYQSAWSVASALVMFNLVGAATRGLKPFFLADK